MNMEPGGFVVSGGGTGGHIFPALAVAKELRAQFPGLGVYYLGKADGMEEELAAREGIPFVGIPAAGFVRSLTPKNLVSAWKAGRGFFMACRWLREHRIQAVLGTGGFVCGPVILAAKFLGIPSVIHESNVVPGLTNRWLGRLANRVAVGHSQTLNHFPAGRGVVTGFPLRPGLNEPSRERACSVFGLDDRKPVLFIFSGSLAARSINRAVAEMLPHWIRRMPIWQILWMTGKADYAWAQRVRQQLDLPVVLREFIYEVPEAYAAADLVLARAGAGTLAELSATGKPALLIPYPYATGNHQMVNASLLEKAGAANVLTDDRLNGDALLESLRKMIANLAALRQAAEAVKAAYPNQAAKELTRILQELAGIKA